MSHSVRKMEEEDSPPGTVMVTDTAVMDTTRGSTLSIKSLSPSQKAREWEKRINQSMGGNCFISYVY